MDIYVLNTNSCSSDEYTGSVACSNYVAPIINGILNIINLLTDEVTKHMGRRLKQGNATL